MLNLFRKLRGSSLEEENSTSGTGVNKYLIYAVGEVLLIMIGILLAVQINKWNEGKQERRDAVQFFQNFRSRIYEDLQIIQGAMDYNRNYREQFQFAIETIEKNDRVQIDSLGYIALKLTKYSDFDRPSNIYESIVNSGEIRLIKNKEIIEKIQILEETYHYFNRMENIHYDLITSIVPELISLIKYSDRSVQDPDRLYDYQFQNILITTEDIMSEKDEIYHRAIGQIQEIITMLDFELNND